MTPRQDKGIYRPETKHSFGQVGSGPFSIDATDSAANDRLFCPYRTRGRLKTAGDYLSGAVEQCLGPALVAVRTWRKGGKSVGLGIERHGKRAVLGRQRFARP